MEIAKKYNVSSTAVAEILNIDNITQQYRKTLMFNNIKLSNYNLRSDDLVLLTEYLKETYPTITSQIIKYNLSINKHKLTSVYDFIDTNCVKKLLSAGETISEISRKMNIKYCHASKKAIELGIERQLIKRCMQTYDKKTLSNLISLYPLKNISKKIKYSTDIIRKVAENYKIAYGIPDDIKEKLQSKQWCNEMYNKHKSYKKISILLNHAVGVDAIANYCQNIHNIPKKELLDEFPRLKEKEYVASIYKHNSITGCARIIGCSEWLFKQCLVSFDIVITHDNSISEGEKELNEFLVGLGVSTITNDRRLISPKEIDIIVPDKKLCIEYCGIYYHSSKFKEKNYHKDKMDLVTKQGYRLITVYESEWEHNKSLVKDKLRFILGLNTNKSIYARKTRIRHVTESDTRRFLEKTHIQGFTKSSIRHGLFYQNQLVALMCFINKKKHYELVRYATISPVQGGFTKLLCHFNNNFKDKPIVSFADLRWSDSKSNIYETNGFTLDKITPPGYYYIYKHKLERREQFMKHKLKDKISNYSDILTEQENLEMNKIYRIYDCGKQKYILNQQLIQ